LKFCLKIIRWNKTLNEKTGNLALALEQKIYSLQGVPFVVPEDLTKCMVGIFYWCWVAD
jgi:hypothetical protein